MHQAIERIFYTILKTNLICLISLQKKCFWLPVWNHKEIHITKPNSMLSGSVTETNSIDTYTNEEVDTRTINLSDAAEKDIHILGSNIIAMVLFKLISHKI